MTIQLSEKHEQQKAEFKAFCDEKIMPFADQWDRDQAIPRSLVEDLAERRYLSSFLSEDIGGLGGDLVTFGLLNEEIGRGCSSARSLLTVHGMVSYALLRWGSRDHKQVLLPQLARGEKIGAFALTEPGAGSDAKGLRAEAVLNENNYTLNGTKKWITFGAIADLFLVFAQVDGKPLALLVERDAPGLEIEPIFGVMGTRASQLATLNFRNCQVPKANVVGAPGFGFSAVALSALSLGRYSVAWGSVGIVRAALEASMDYASKRKQFDKYLKDQQLVREMLTEMIVDLKAARLLCYHGGLSEERGDQHAMLEILKAKYFASRAAVKASGHAVQIHGAVGCHEDYPVARLYRDAKIMEIIEGSTQMQQIMIPKFEYEQFFMDQM